jgi:hypothetical protein
MFVKKLRERIHLCINYRLLNIITKKDCYLISLIKKTMVNIAGYKIITKLNIQKAFNKIRIIILKNKDLLTFYTLFSNYKPKVLQFSPINSLITFQRFINNTLFDYLNVFCTVYINNILIYNQSQKEHT